MTAATRREGARETAPTRPRRAITRPVTPQPAARQSSSPTSIRSLTVGQFDQLPIGVVAELPRWRKGQYRRSLAPADLDRYLAVITWLLRTRWSMHVPRYVNEDKPGPCNRYPPLLVFSLIPGARVFRSYNRLFTELLRPISWHLVRRTWKAETGEDLHYQPPTWETLRYYRDKYLTSAAVEELSTWLITTGLRLAWSLRLAVPGEPETWAAPSPLNTIAVDGTWVSSFSEAYLTYVTDDSGGIVDVIAVHSRAKRPGTARVQWEKNRSRKNGRSVGGLLHAAVTIRVPGQRETRVVLGVAVADPPQQAENHLTMRLLRTVLRQADGGIHLIAVDGVLTGRDFDELVSKYGVPCIGRQPADGRHGHTFPPIADLSNVVGFRLAHKKGRTFLKRTLVWDMEPLQITRGARRCSHDLVFDDGALWVVEPHPESVEHRRRVQMLLATRAWRRRDQNGYWFELEFIVPCPHGDHPYRVEVHPQARGPRPSHYIRLIPETAPVLSGRKGYTDDPRDRFAKLFFRREDAESTWRWYKFYLPFGRAHAMTGIWQLLDFIAGAIVTNTDTWAAQHRVG